MHAAARVMGQSQSSEVLVSASYHGPSGGVSLKFSERGSQEQRAPWSMGFICCERIVNVGSWHETDPPSQAVDVRSQVQSGPRDASKVCNRTQSGHQ